MNLRRPTPETARHREGIPGRLRAHLHGPNKTSGHIGVFHPIMPAALFLAVLCLLTGLGCSSDKRAVEDVALQWIEGIKTGDAATFERIIDWERWYSTYSSGGRPGAGTESPKEQEGKDQTRRAPASPGQTVEMSEDLKYQKGLLVSVLSGDRILATQYLTADNKISRVSIKASEAVAEISQEDRVSGARKRIILQLHKDPEAGWRIYKFAQEKLQDV